MKLERRRFQSLPTCLSVSLPNMPKNFCGNVTSANETKVGGLAGSAAAQNETLGLISNVFGENAAAMRRSDGLAFGV